MKPLKKMILSSLFIALALVLPFFIGQVPVVGQMLLPMHYPIFLCGLVCGWQYGLVVGFISPILRSFLFGMPILFPNGIAMAFELATYGFMIGYIYHAFKKQNLFNLYISLLLAMICGRIVWGCVEYIIIQGFTPEMFIAGAFLNALPGILIQFILIPAIMIILNHAHIIHFRR